MAQQQKQSRLSVIFENLLAALCGLKTQTMRVEEMRIQAEKEEKEIQHKAAEEAAEKKHQRNLELMEWQRAAEEAADAIRQERVLALEQQKQETLRLQMATDLEISKEARAKREHEERIKELEIKKIAAQARLLEAHKNLDADTQMMVLSGLLKDTVMVEKATKIIQLANAKAIIDDLDKILKGDFESITDPTCQLIIMVVKAAVVGFIDSQPEALQASLKEILPPHFITYLRGEGRKDLFYETSVLLTLISNKNSKEQTDHQEIAKEIRKILDPGLKVSPRVIEVPTPTPSTT